MISGTLTIYLPFPYLMTRVCYDGMLQDEYATFGVVVEKKPASFSWKAKAVLSGFLLLAVGAFVGLKAGQALAEPLRVTNGAERTRFTVATGGFRPLDGGACTSLARHECTSEVGCKMTRGGCISL